MLESAAAMFITPIGGGARPIPYYPLLETGCSSYQTVVLLRVAFGRGISLHSCCFSGFFPRHWFVSCREVWERLCLEA